MLSCMLLLCMQGIAPEQMGAIVAQRLDRLDHLVIEVVWRQYRAPAGSPLDRNAWEAVHSAPGAFPHRLTIVRPHALDEFLTSGPTRGYVPARYAAHQTGVTSRHMNPLPSGRIFWEQADLVDYRVPGGTSGLQAFDLHIRGSRIPLYNLKRIFDGAAPELVRSVGNVSTYTATQDMGKELQHHFEFDLSSDGLLLRFKMVQEWPRAGGPDLVRIVEEQFTLASRPVNGAELPWEVALVHYPDRPDASHALVDFMQVTSAEHRPELAPVEAQLQPVLVNAVVSVWKYTEATHAVYEYDEQGQLIRESSQKLARAASLPGGRRFARLAVPWVAAGAGSAVCLGLLLVTRRRS